MAALNYWLWLTGRKGIGSAGLLTLLDHFGGPERVYYASEEELEQLSLNAAQREALLDKDLSRSDAILGECERLGVQIMTIQDADYPQRLRAIADPPAVLYIRGRAIRFDEEAAIAVVGARTPSVYGQRWAERFGLELADGGAVVVSGIAEGLDSCALRGAMKAGGTVVSVLAGGVDVPFPRQNRYLYEDVAASGALISEYPPGTPHLGAHFIQRNRILSGLCLGVLAVECRPFGGTMSTVSHALEQNRDVFAVPGSLDAPMSEGTNLLIRQGAKLVTCGRDILEEYWGRFPGKLGRAAPMTPEAVQERLDDLRNTRRVAAPKLREAASGEKPPKAVSGSGREIIPRQEQKRRFTDDELALLAAVSRESRTADELVELTQIPAKRVLSALTMLQVQGAMEERPGKRFYALVTLEE